jgi:putative hemolysin
MILASVFMLSLLCLHIFGCGSPQKYMLSKEDAQQERVKEQSGLANPASIYCMNQTDTDWELRESPAGQYGICIFPDGSWCEEWAFYRGQCLPGTNMTSCEGEAWGKAVCPPGYDPVCGRLADGGWQTFTNKCSACTAEENVTGYVLGECE